MYACFLILLPAVIAQYSFDTGMKPDVRFDERNERYDIGPLMDPGDYVVQDYRRQGANRPQSAKYNSLENTKNLLRLIDDKLKQSQPTSPADKSISQLIQLLDQARRAGGGTRNRLEDHMNYLRNLRYKTKETRRNLVQYLHGQPESISRRSGLDHDKEVLLHHAVPIVMNVQGFLKMPVGGE